MAYDPSAFCDRSRQVVAFLVSIGLVVSSLVVPWLTSTASASAPVVTNYTDPCISGPSGITAGPDGALWFTNNVTNSIGRITTSGVVTNYTDPSIGSPQRITAGPDGALWFTNYANNSIGRITGPAVLQRRACSSPRAGQRWRDRPPLTLPPRTPPALSSGSSAASTAITPR